MSNEERRRKERQKPDVPTSQKFKTASLCVYHRATLMHPASVYISQQYIKWLHTHLYIGIQSSGFKPLARCVIFIASHEQLVFVWLSFFVLFCLFFFLTSLVTFLGHCFYFCFCFNLTQARVIWKEGPSSVKMPLWNWFTRAQQTVKNIPPWPLHQLLLPDLPEFQSWLPSVMNNSMEV